jgi:hypothetical protein
MNANTQNVWPHVVISAIILGFCAFLVWRSPSSLETAILMAGAIAGWWIPAPGSSGGNLLTSLLSVAQPSQPVPTPPEQTDVTASMKAVPKETPA